MNRIFKCTALVVLPLGLFAAACDETKRNSDNNSRGNSNTLGTNNPGNTNSLGGNDVVDNNKPQEGLTATDQKENKADVEITQRIRQNVMKADSLSMTAKNIKIITIDGVVTLRGAVASDSERTSILTLAQNVSGVKQVDNKLEVSAN